MVISNCEITKQDSKVLKDCVMTNTSSLYKEYGSYHTGMDIAGDNVYSMYDGTVVSAGRSGSKYSVIIQTGSSVCMCYKNLTSKPSVNLGDNVSSGDLIGHVNGYVHVEALTKQKSLWAVRVGTNTWYKYDVSAVIYGGISQLEDSDQAIQFSSLDIAELSNYPSGTDDTVSGESQYILSNNRGD